MSKSRFAHLKPEILRLRKEGLSYSQIQERIGVKVSQSTLSNWCSSVRLSTKAQKLLRKRMVGDSYRKAVVSQIARERRQKRREAVGESNAHLKEILEEADVSKIALAMLYLGEGLKNEKRCVQFGNSNPGIIRLFMKLFTQVYDTDPAKFRIRIQCRADQDIPSLERFWKKVLGSGKFRFYPTWKDKRTVGKPTRKEGYMGVCGIAYIDNRIQFELVNLGNLLCQVSEGP